ncbi:MAG: hypothetical protein JWR00_1906, partial [Rubritepida sp.]|nr:hypothetical protein [Rubritepida sp.]
MAPDTQALADPSPSYTGAIRGAGAPKRGRFLGRIGTRAAVILILMFSVLAFLAGNSL